MHVLYSHHLTMHEQEGELSLACINAERVQAVRISFPATVPALASPYIVTLFIFIVPCWLCYACICECTLRAWPTTVIRILPVFGGENSPSHPATYSIAFAIGLCFSDFWYLTFCGTSTQSQHQLCILPANSKAARTTSNVFISARYKLFVSATGASPGGGLPGCWFVLRHACALALRHHRS